MVSHLSRLVLSVFFFFHLCLAAPGQPGTLREEESFPALANVFGSGEENRRLLQSYIDTLQKDGQAGPKMNSWEQEVFFLFRHYDYDRSGFLDGLEMIKLLLDYNAHHRPGVVQSYDQVVSMVDFLLQSQDLNHDGLFSPSELLSPPLPQTQMSSNNNIVHQVDDTSSNTKPGVAVEEQKRAQNEMELQLEAQLQQEERTEEDNPVAALDEQHAQQAPDDPGTENKQNVAVPVHQGQPEI